LHSRPFAGRRKRQSIKGVMSCPVHCRALLSAREGWV